MTIKGGKSLAWMDGIIHQGYDYAKDEGTIQVVDVTVESMNVTWDSATVVCRGQNKMAFFQGQLCGQLAEGLQQKLAAEEAGKMMADALISLSQMN